MQANEQSRKPVKGKGIDPEAARRNREGRAVQIRKEKRFDRANVERRKVTWSNRCSRVFFGLQLIPLLFVVFT